MHLKCLLKGVPRETLKQAIFDGHSMTLCFPEHRIFSSAIVGGVLPIAVGIAAGIKREGKPERVHCFLGDTTAMTGGFTECLRYSMELPIRWIVEDNELSVCTPTNAAWPPNSIPTSQINSDNYVRFRYKSKWPHAGAGKRVQF